MLGSRTKYIGLATLLQNQDLPSLLSSSEDTDFLLKDIATIYSTMATQTITVTPSALLRMKLVSDDTEDVCCPNPSCRRPSVVIICSYTRS
jgi:hypothetical protein